MTLEHKMLIFARHCTDLQAKLLSASVEEENVTQPIGTHWVDIKEAFYFAAIISESD